LKGWKLVAATPGYVVRTTKLYARRRRGNLFTEKEFGNFVFRFEFALTAARTMASAFARPMRGTPLPSMRFKFSTMATGV